MITHLTASLLGIMAAVSCSGMGDGCRAQEGVREVVENGKVRLVSIARVSSNSKDEESIRFAASQGEVKAKDQLIRYRAAKGTAIRMASLSGVVLRGSCGSGRYLYVTVETSEALRRNSRTLRQKLKESVSRMPTPTTR